MHDAPGEIVPDNGMVFPVSFAQQRLWFLDQLHANNTMHHIPLALRLQGQLRLAALHQALNAVVQRHEALRTTFRTLNEQPVQIIASCGRVELPVIDLSHQPEPARQVEIERLLREKAKQPFDLSRDLMLRATLFRLGPAEHILSLVLHHIAADGWSVGVLFRDLGAFYDAFCREQPVALPALPIQYADYAVWQRDLLAGDDLQRQLQYWRELLANASPRLELPTDRPRPASPSYQGALLSQTLPPALGEALRELSRREGATLYMTLLAAFQTLLYRYSGQDDILVGSPIAGRTQVQIEGLIGFFVNTVVLRGRLADNPSFRELLRQTRDQAVNAYAHQEMPFEKLVEDLRPKRDLSQSPFFQVMFILQSGFTEEMTLPGLTTTFLPVHTGTSSFELTLSLAEHDLSLEMTVEYRTELFNVETIRRLMGHYQTLLEGIVANPDERVNQLPLLSRTEQQQLLVEWNATQREFPKDKCLQELFEAQVKRTPDAVGLIVGNRSLSYAELNRRANQLAHRLKEMGVSQDVLVGLCVERTVEMIVAMLGILKAGGAYVPLDPSYPAERLAFILEDAQAPVLLTQSTLRPQLPENHAQVVCLDTTEFTTDKTNPASSARPHNLAYVIYTSGSTGKPKGVAIEHRSPVALVHWAQEAFTPGELAGVLASTSICFDLSVFEIFLTLSSGGKVILAENALALPTLPAAQQVTLINTVPSAMKELLRVQGVPSSVRVVNLAGEPTPTSLVQQIHQLPHVEKVYDLYGPSETTTYSTVALRSVDGPATIGRPIANTRIYLLDLNGQPVPVGVLGEIHIGGDGLARGYLHRPELTAGKFVPDPFSSQPGARLYRTGDLAKYLPDGNLEFLGRMDHQVKIRGFRVELGEIESVLHQHPSVKEVVVMARQDTPGEKRLVAYIVPKTDQTPAIADLRTHLGQKLPEHMVPSAFVTLTELPMTPNSKVNRKALPAPDQIRPDLGGIYVAARDPLEQQLTQLWQNIFSVEPIGIHDNFFELGGHSLLAVRLFAQIKKLTGKELPLVTLFQAPTVEQLAAILHQEGWETPWASLVPIKAGGSKSPFYCVHGVGGNILEYLDLAKHMEADQPFYGLQAIGLDGKRPIQNLSLEQMAAQYVAEIRAFQSHGPYYVGGSSFGGLVAYEIAQQLVARGEQVALLAFFDTNAPGYPRLLPTTTAWQQKWNWWRDRVQLHWGNLRASSAREKLTYVCEKAQRWNKQMRWKCQRLWDQIRERVGRVFWPAAIKQARVMGFRAATGYTPKPYPGRATLFRATEQPRGIYSDRTLGWGNLVQGGLKIYSTPGHHGAIVREPRSRILAQQLTDALHNTQTAKSASRPFTMEESKAVSRAESMTNSVLELGTLLTEFLADGALELGAILTILAGIQ